MQPDYAPCPVCGAHGFDLARVFDRPKHAHRMYRCRRCTVVADGRAWDLDASCNLAAQAAATGEWYTRHYTPEEFERRMQVARGTLGEFRKFMGETELFVELGVGEGFLSRAAAGVFDEVVGLDIDLTAARNVTRQFGCPTNLRFLRHDGFGDLDAPTVSVAALWHVLEHLNAPLPVLRPFLDRMPVGGLVIGQVPLLREDYVFDEHFLFHNESSLFHLAFALGCAPILMQRDEDNDFLSFCFRKQAAAVPAAPTQACAAAEAGGPPPTLRRLGMPALFVFGHQRSGTNILLDTLAGSIGCDVLNEDHPSAFANFRLRPAAEVAALVAASADGCLLKPITESLRFREIMAGIPGSRAVFVIRNPLEVVPSFLMEFRDSLASVAYQLVHNYRWTRLRDVGVELECWAETDRLMEKYGGRFDPRADAASVVALSWLALHAALAGRGLLDDPACAIVDYADLFDLGGALERKLRPVFGGAVQMAPARRRARETHAFASRIDVELATDCLDMHERFRAASGRVRMAAGAPAQSTIQLAEPADA